MGIHDRKYMSGPPGSGSYGNLQKTVTLKIVFFCVGIFLMDILLNGQLSQHLLFDTVAVRNFEIWRIFTAAFFGNTVSFIWVALSLYIFYSLGNFLENSLGANRFINLLFFSILGHSFLALFLPVNGMGFFDGILSSVFLAYGLILGSQKFTLLLFFVLPLTLSGHMLVGLTVALIAFQSFNSWTHGIPMLGGCAAVYIFISQYQMGKNLDLLKYLKPKPKSKGGEAKGRPFQPNTIQRNFSIVEDNQPIEDDVDSYIKDKVDPILEKIAKSGMSSLTKEEKKILENAKKKIGDR